MKCAALTVVAVAIMMGRMSSFGQLIVAHRGASHDAPENTLAAFRLAWEQGADGIEGDFYLTKDGQIACIHDATTKRTGGGTELKVADSTLAELRRLEYGAWKSAKYKGEAIPTLEQVLALVPAGKLFYIEIKCGPEILLAMAKVIEQSGVKAEQLRIISFKAEVIAEAKKLMPAIKAHWISSFKKDEKDGTLTPTRETIKRTLQRIKADGFNAKAEPTMLTKEFVSELKGMGLEVAAWTVDDPAMAKTLREAGVWGITTNRPGYLREQMK